MTLGRKISWAIAILLAGALLWLVLRGVDWSIVGQTITSAHWGLLAISAVSASCSFLLRAVRWRLLLNAEGRVGVSTVFWSNMAGYLGNAFLPARAGELVRSMLVSRHGALSKTYVLTTALGERLADAVALVLSSSLILLLGVHPKPPWLTGVSRAMTVVGAAGVLAIVVLPRTGRLLATVVTGLPLGRLQKPLLAFTEQALLGLRAFHQWKRLMGFAVLTVAIWLMDAFTSMIIGRALGLNLGLATVILLLTGLGLSSALPSTPGYIGIYQFVAVSVLAPFGVGRNAALAFILVFQTVGYAVVLVYGVCGLYVLEGRGSFWRSVQGQRQPGRTSADA